MSLRDLSNEVLVARLCELCLQGQKVLAGILEYLVEVEDRELFSDAACPSLYDYCVRRLGMSEDEACRRIGAARIVRRFPQVLPLIAAGSIHLTTLTKLGHYLTDENVDDVMAEASGKTKRELEIIIARRWPRPDVPSGFTDSAHETPADGAVEAVFAELRGGGAKVTALSPGRHHVEFTASDALRRKLERAQDLMAHRNPSRDLAAVVESAVELLLAKLERERLGKTSRPAHPRQRGQALGPVRVSQEVRRTVFERDGEQCSFQDREGNRCPATSRLELDHIKPRALGGTNDADNLRVRCAAHNLHWARKVFGKDLIATKQRLHRRQITTRRLIKIGVCEADAKRAIDALELRYRDGRLPALQNALREAITYLKNTP